MRKELPRIEIDSGTFFLLPHEALKWELLKTAIELNLFDRTVEPATAAELAGSLSLHPSNTEYVLNALVALGCLTKADGQYKNTPLDGTGRPCHAGRGIRFHGDANPDRSRRGRARSGRNDDWQKGEMSG